MVATGVTGFMAKPLKDPYSRVPLIQRLDFVVPENLLNTLVKTLLSRGDLRWPFGISLATRHRVTLAEWSFATDGMVLAICPWPMPSRWFSPGAIMK